jgi:hypothetical protein
MLDIYFLNMLNIIFLYLNQFFNYIEPNGKDDSWCQWFKILLKFIIVVLK